MRKRQGNLQREQDERIALTGPQMAKGALLAVLRSQSGPSGCSQASILLHVTV